MSSRTVAVQFSGCEMRIIDGCRLPGRYAWRRTTLATDTIEITNADDLYAKLPLGALSLEGELERSGRLAVRTTVAGQLQLEGLQAEVAKADSCADATHVVSAISVGAFKLLSGGAARAQGGAGALGVGAGVSSRQTESVMRESGVQDACAAATAENPDPQCGAPIQLFLEPLRRSGAGGEVDSSALQEQVAKQAGGVQVSFAAPEEGERWTLRDAGGTQLCELPCQKWVGQSSGYYLQRERAGKKDVATVPMPPAFGYPPGSAVEATYRPERGSPFWSSMGFYFVGLPSAALGAVFLGFGLEQTISGRDCSEFRDCPLFGSAGGNLGISLFYLSFAGASFYWYLWSHEAEVEVKRPGGDARGASAVRWAGAAPSGLSSLQLSANGLRGSFW
ncbi:MAG: hypothetical protein KC766_23120 [Myxococcales bacterium]|nr:hypothetical protein [Myxococcales bacterium]